MCNIIYERLKNLRVHNGLSQDDLAKKLNVSRQTIWRWENKAIPDAMSLVELSKLYNVPIEYLLCTNEYSGNVIGLSEKSIEMLRLLSSQKAKSKLALETLNGINFILEKLYSERKKGKKNNILSKYYSFFVHLSKY